MGPKQYCYILRRCAKFMVLLTSSHGFRVSYGYGFADSGWLRTSGIAWCLFGVGLKQHCYLLLLFGVGLKQHCLFGVGLKQHCYFFRRCTGSGCWSTKTRELKAGLKVYVFFEGGHRIGLHGSALVGMGLQLSTRVQDGLNGFGMVCGVGPVAMLFPPSTCRLSGKRGLRVMLLLKAVPSASAFTSSAHIFGEQPLESD